MSLTDGPHSVEQRRFALKTFKDLNKTSKGSEELEGPILCEAANLIQRLKASDGKPISVRQFFNLNVLNFLMELLIGRKFSSDDPQFAQISHHLTRYWMDHTDLINLPQVTII